MSGEYRDDRGALRQQVERLERELAEARAADTDDALAREIDALAERLSEARARLEADRAELGDVSEALDRIRSRLGTRVEPQHERASERNLRYPLLGLFATGIVVVGLWVVSRASSKPSTAPLWSGIPGAPDAVDPGALLDQARARARGHPDLIGIKVVYVPSSGLVDLDTQGYASRIIYSFGRPGEDPAPDPARPLGAPTPGGSLPSTLRVVVSREGFVDEFAMIGFSGRALPVPRCSAASVWKSAMGAGAPADAVAVLEYEWGRPDPLKSRESVPVWRFGIEGTRHTFTIEDGSCRVLD